MFPLSAITGNAALDVLVGLFFLYFLLSIVCSAVNEGIASALNLRAKNLEEAIFSLLGDEAHAKAFYEHHRITALFKPGKADGKPTVGGRKPSYIPSRAFAMTLLDMFIPATPPAGDAPTPHLVEAVKAELAKVDAIKNDRVRGLLQDAIHEAGGDANRFRTAIERSYDEVMDRASGWYKRKVQVILLAIAFALVVVINADSFGIGQRLWKDDALRAAVVAQANTAVQSGKATCVTSGASAPTLARMEDTLTVGYAQALALEAERWRLERRLGEVARTVGGADPDVSRFAEELSVVAKRLTSADGELANLRALLGSLRDRARSMRRAALVAH